LKFRLAKRSDVSRVASILEKFYSKHVDMYGIPWDRESAERTILETIDDGLTLIGKGCCIGGIIKPWQWNKDQNIAFVVFWKAESHGGMRIFDVFRKVVEEKFNARVIAASQFPDNRILRFYAKRGLKPMEVHAITDPWVTH